MLYEQRAFHAAPPFNSLMCCYALKHCSMPVVFNLFSFFLLSLLSRRCALLCASLCLAHAQREHSKLCLKYKYHEYPVTRCAGNSESRPDQEQESSDSGPQPLYQTYYLDASNRHMWTDGEVGEKLRWRILRVH